MASKPKALSFINIPQRPTWEGPQIDDMPDFPDATALLQGRHGRYVLTLEKMANVLSRQSAIPEWTMVMKVLMEYSDRAMKLKVPKPKPPPWKLPAEGETSEPTDDTPDLSKVPHDELVRMMRDEEKGGDGE